MSTFSYLFSLVAVAFLLTTSSCNGQFTLARRAHRPAKPVLLASRDGPLAAVEEREGVYTLPLIVTEGVETNSSLVRRGSTETVPFDFNTLSVQVAINGKPYTYALQTGTDITTGYNVQAAKGAWIPSKDPQAKVNGPPSANNYHGLAQEVTVNSFSLGKTTVKNFNMIYEAEPNKGGRGPVGDLGLGLRGATFGGKPETSTNFLEQVAKAGLWAKPVFTVAMRHGSAGQLVLGAEIPSPNPAIPTAWSSSQKNHWALTATIGGHTGLADFVTTSPWITVPPQVAEDLIKKAGLTADNDGRGNIVAKFDCSRRPQADLTIDFEGGRLQIPSLMTAIPKANAKECLYVVRGTEQGPYPTPFSLGLPVFQSYNVHFSFEVGAPKIGFGVRDWA